VENVSLLSGGLDSAVITAVSTVQKAYCVGLKQNNEFDEARDTAHLLHRRLVTVDVSTEELRGAWRYLTKLRGEPLCVPNEGLIYLVCKAMEPTERVFLTGEGADELLFGYNVIVEWAADNKWAGVKDFLLRYGYSQVPEPTDRLCEHIEMLRSGKTGIEFIEDLFYELHLPGLLRRMDFAAMAASKEARVPFVCKDLVSYMYRRPAKIRLTSGETKIPLRRFAERLGLHRVLTRKKIGFSAQIEPEVSRYDAYMDFQQATLGALSW
jgi:asparagine synthase (glutamine-hydrolysing)